MASRRTGRKPPESAREAYHHGNLRDALIDVAVEMIETSGVSGFSMAEACRRLNVTVAAPYRHFADRDALLTAVAIRSCETLAGVLRRTIPVDAEPADQLAELTKGWVHFAAEYPALFDTMFAKDVFMPGNVELASAIRPVVEAFVVPARALEPDSVEVALRVVVGVAAIAHGYAVYLRAGSFAQSEDGLRTAADNAMLASRALIAGRDELRAKRAAPEISLAGWGGQTWLEEASGALHQVLR